MRVCTKWQLKEMALGVMSQPHTVFLPYCACDSAGWHDETWFVSVYIIQSSEEPQEYFQWHCALKALCLKRHFCCGFTKNCTQWFKDLQNAQKLRFSVSLPLFSVLSLISNCSSQYIYLYIFIL